MSDLRRVGLNLLYLVPGETGGTEAYARRLIPELAAQRPELELVAFLNRESAAVLSDGTLGAGVETVATDVEGRSRVRRALAEQVLLPRLARRHDIDLLHSLATTAPARAGVPSVVTLHDVIYALEPSAHSLAMRAGMRVLVPLAAGGASRIVTSAEAAALDIVGVLGVERARIDVVPLGGSTPGPATPEPELRRRLGLGASPIVSSVSARRAHKNLERLITAFARVRSDPPPLLVLPGYATRFEDDLRARARSLGVGERVRVLGWLSEEDLEGLYAASACFAFPSLIEGFGLPVLEAMQRGVPVACSNVSAMPEVAGEAARYFDPLSVEQIKAAIEDVLRDPDLAERLSRAGRERARLFSWERTARETLAVYEHVADRAPLGAGVP